MTTQPADEHHTGTLNLTGQGNPAQSPISDELIQDATIGWYEATPGVSWDEAGKYERAAMLARTRLILVAAYPAIRQQVAEQIAAALENFEANDPRGRADISIDRAAAMAREIGGEA